jgi:hypothetical protein
VTEILATIDAPHFNAGIVLQNDRVVQTAPIIHYMHGWTRHRVRVHCENKGWKVSVVWQMERNSVSSVSRRGQ